MKTDRDPRRVLVRAATVVAALYLTVGLAVLVPWSDGRSLRGVARVLALVVGWVGVYGVVRERPPLVEIAALGLALLGFWQPVAWVVVLPTGGVLAGVAALLARAADEPEDGSEPTGSDADDESGDDGEPTGSDADDENGADTDGRDESPPAADGADDGE